MRSFAAILCVCAAAAMAQTALGPAGIGCFRDDAGRLRFVYGVAGNFIVGDPGQDGVVAAACVAGRSLLKTETYLELRDRDRTSRWDAPAGPALVALSANGAAAACFAGQSECLWLEREEVPRVVPLGGEALAVAIPGAERLAAVVRRERGLWLVEASPANGSIEKQFEFAGVSAPLLLRADGSLVYFDAVDLVIRDPHGAERRAGLPSPPAALEPLGEDWVRIILENTAGHLAIKIGEDGGALFRLPEVQP